VFSIIYGKLEEVWILYFSRNGDLNMEQALKYNSYQKTVSIPKTFFWCLMLIVYGTNFLNIGIYTPIFLLPYIFIYVMKNRLTKNFFVSSSTLFLFSILYSGILFMYGFIDYPSQPVMFLVFPLILIVMGYKLVDSENNYQKAYTYIFLVIFSLSLFGFLSVIKTINKFGVESISLGRTVISIWNDSLITATGLNTFLSFGLILLPILFISFKGVRHGRMMKLLCAICFFTSIYSTIVLGNRTGLGIVAISILTIFLFSKKHVAKKYLNMMLGLIFLFIFRILFNQNFLGIRYEWESTLLSSRLNGQNLSEDPRLLSWNAAFKGLFDYPMGGRETPLPLSFAHNMWLDVGYDAGLLPFIVLIIFTVFSFGSLMFFIKSNHPILLKSLLVGIFTAFYITFMVEPIFQGWFTHFTLYCFMVGLVQRLNFEYKKKSKFKEA
jgi:hypothetical protein